MRGQKDRATLLLLILALLLAIWGQRTFLQKRELIWDGIVFYAVAMLAFSLVMGRLEGREEVRGISGGILKEVWWALGQSVTRLVVLVIGVGSVLYAALSVPARASALLAGHSSGLRLGLWAGGMALFAAAFVDWGGIPTAWRQLWHQLRVNGFEVGLVVVIMVGTCLVRAVRLETVPHVLSGDEAAMGLEALSVLEGRSTDPFRTGWLSHATLYFYLQAAALSLFGVSVASLRALSPLVSTAIVPMLYLFARRSYGRWVALLAASFFLAYHYAIHFGRIALNNIWDPFFAVATIYCLEVGLEKRRPFAVVMGGLMLGLAVYFYMGAQLIPIILALYLLHRALSDRDFLDQNLTYLLIFAAAALLAALPLLLYFRAHPAEMMARWRWIGIFPSGWVDAEVQRTGKSVAGVVFGQFLKAVLAFNYSHDPTFHYRPNRPLLLTVTSILFVLGLTYAIRRSRDRRYFLLWVWFLLVIIFGGALVENPPSSPRLVLSIPAVVILVALGATKLGEFVQRVLGRPSAWGIVLSCLLVAVGCYSSLHFYFGEYIPNEMYSDQNTAIADRLGRYAHALGPGYQLYFFGAPRMYYGHATIPFLARGVPGVDVNPPVPAALDFVDRSRDAVFVLLPERQGELQDVRRVYPSGRLREFRDRKGQLLFISYEVEM